MRSREPRPEGGMLHSVCHGMGGQHIPLPHTFIVHPPPLQQAGVLPEDSPAAQSSSMAADYIYSVASILLNNPQLNSLALHNHAFNEMAMGVLSNQLEVRADGHVRIRSFVGPSGRKYQICFNCLMPIRLQCLILTLLPHSPPVQHWPHCSEPQREPSECPPGCFLAGGGVAE